VRPEHLFVMLQLILVILKSRHGAPPASEHP
jgi:hypothetical protein